MDIFVGNLPYEITENELKDMFSAHGTVNRIKLLTDRDTGRPRGIAFVTMDDFKEAQAAIKATDGQELAGRPMKVNQARERDPQGGGGAPRHGGGNFNRGGGGGGGGFRGRDRY